MIWTPAQVRAMEGYTFAHAVDMFLLERATQADGTNPVVDEVVNHLFRGLQEAGHTHGLEIDRGDLHIETRPDEAGHFMTNVIARWQPTTRAGLLIGGPVGGTSYVLEEHLHRRGIRVQVIQPAAARGLWVEKDDATVLAPVHAQVYYEYAGWSEPRRMWVYRVGNEGK